MRSYPFMHVASKVPRPIAHQGGANKAQLVLLVKPAAFGQVQGEPCYSMEVQASFGKFGNRIAPSRVTAGGGRGGTPYFWNTWSTGTISIAVGLTGSFSIVLSASAVSGLGGLL
jgi:hypothetical protein